MKPESRPTPSTPVCEHWCGKKDCADEGRHYHHDKSQCTPPCGATYQVCPSCSPSPSTCGTCGQEKCDPECWPDEGNPCNGCHGDCHPAPQQEEGWEAEYDALWLKRPDDQDANGGRDIKRFISSLLLSRDEAHAREVEELKTSMVEAWDKSVEKSKQTKDAYIALQARDAMLAAFDATREAQLGKKV